MCGSISSPLSPSIPSSVLMASYKFSVLDTLPSINEPLTQLSALSADPEWQQKQNWPSHYYYCQDGFEQLPELLTHLQTEGNFCLSANINKNKLVYTSGPQLTLSLTDSTYSHNSYVGRYLRFIKVVPPKYGPDLDTFYTASVSLDANAKYYKDFTVLLARVFPACSICLLLDTEVPFPLTRVSSSFLTTTVASHSDLSPLTTSEIPSEYSRDFYEYLCLLHLNGLPDYSNSHVGATTIYEVPTTTNENSGAEHESLHLHITKNINPSAMKSLVLSEGWISAFARSTNYNIVLLNTPSGIYMWEIHN